MALNVEALSDIMIRSKDFRLVKRLKASMKDSSVKCGINSRRTVLLDAQVNKQTYALCSLPVQSRTYRAPVKSTPVTVKGVVSSTLYLVNG